MNALAMFGMKLQVTAFELIERFIKRRSLVGDKRFFDARDFPWVKAFEAEYPAIRAEMLEVLKYRDALPSFQDISEEQAMITRDARWKTFFLHAYGRKMSLNCKVCPHTAQALKRIPGLTTAFFSILMPHKVIPIHRGPYCGVLRYHLGLMVPAPTECGIEVGGIKGGWEEGKSLIFDDTYLHKAWNNSERIRVVLFVDFKRPLPLLASLLNNLWIFVISRSTFVRRSVRRQKSWDRIFEEAYRQTGE